MADKAKLIDILRIGSQKSLEESNQVLKKDVCNMKNLYLLLAILGGIIPYLFFFQFIQIEGLNIPLFIDSLFVNGAAGGFSVDLLISSFVFWLFMFKESENASKPKPFLFILINLTIGLSCALPAYLYAKASVKNTK